MQHFLRYESQYLNLNKFQPNFSPCFLYTHKDYWIITFPVPKMIDYFTLHYSSGNSFILGFNFQACFIQTREILDAL